MNRLIKLVMVLGILLASVESFSSVESIEENYRGRLIEGRVIYGPTLTCEIWNDSHRPIRVMNYSYEIFYRNRFGGIDMARRDFHCRYNCRVRTQTPQVFSGPVNNGPTVYANCFAFVR
ncbi:hypothetical protein [Halobacteriovorax marinus]|uniref:hypothetical protein n=1 Tax=Halobacteriovorax marinus TaxID=97084 RepID=UPI003A90B3CB